MRYIAILIFVLFFSAGVCHGAGRADTQAGCKKVCPGRAVCKVAAKAADRQSPLDEVLAKLQEQADKLVSYQAKIDYLFVQDPEMLDSRSLRRGEIYYLKDKAGSNLRVNFATVRQDDEDEQKYIKQFVFDGVWLRIIDYQLEKVDSYQQSPEGEPVDVFEHITHYFPMIGFSKTASLKSDFDITLVESAEIDEPNFIHLHLKVKAGSAYREDYETVDFWVDNESFLPIRLVSISTEGDRNEILLSEVKINKKLKNSVFKVETPQHFSQNKRYLKKN